MVDARPISTMRPRYMIPIRSHMNFAVARSWVMNRYVKWYFAFSSIKNSSMRARTDMSSIATGSSATISCGRNARTRAATTRCFCPAEEPLARCGADESDEGLRNRALAAATLSHESEDLALRDGKSHAIHGVDSCIAAAEEPLNETAEDWKVHLQVADFEERFRHWDRPSRDGMRPSDGPLPRVAAPGTRSRKRPSVCHIADRTGIPRSRREDSGARRGPNRDSSSPNR